MENLILCCCSVVLRDRYCVFQDACHQEQENVSAFVLLLVFFAANGEAMTLLPWL